MEEKFIIMIYQITLKDYIGKLKESAKPKELAKKEKTSTYS